MYYIYKIAFYIWWYIIIPIINTNRSYNSINEHIINKR